jgi:hypothetical protein
LCQVFCLWYIHSEYRTKGDKLENADKLPWIIGVAVVILTIIVMLFWKQNAAEKRLTAKKLAEKQLIQGVSQTFTSDDLTMYKALPDSAARRQWLQENRSDFMDVVQCQYDPNALISHWVDKQILDTPPNFHSSVMVYETQDISLNEYQVVLNELIKEYRRREEAARAERERLAAERRKREQAATTYWASLTDEEKAAFKKARGPQERQSIIENTQPRSDYSAEVLTTVIMSTQFGGVSGSTGQSIDYCESSVSNHSGFDGGGFSDGGCSSDAGGGGGD